jgi:CheY-like chemotaxis protein
MTKPRILIIDDEASFTRLLRLNLESTGKYEVRDENWPTKAVAVAKDFRPDLIFLDVMMPGMDGGEIKGRLREVPFLQKTPIVFLTAAVTPVEVEAHKGVIGGEPYLAKPVDLDEIEQCIEKQLGHKPAQASARPDPVPLPRPTRPKRGA